MTLCVEWTGARTSTGYGAVRHGSKSQLVHRVEWERHFGPIPPGMFVCHSCDNPPCCNIEHLFLGTPMDNVRDMIAKGRQRHPKKDHCHRGHPLAGSQARVRLTASGARECLECGKIKKRLRRTHCINGHPLPEPSLSPRRTRRRCKECASKAGAVWSGNVFDDGVAVVP